MELDEMNRVFDTLENPINRLAIEAILNRLFPDIKNHNLGRIILILRYVNIALCKRVCHNYYTDYAKCLNVYVLTLSEAAISVKDVEDFLNSAFIRDRGFVTETLSVFKELFLNQTKAKTFIAKIAESFVSLHIKRVYSKVSLTACRDL